MGAGRGPTGPDGKSARQYGAQIPVPLSEVTEDTLRNIKSLVEEDRRNPPAAEPSAPASNWVERVRQTHTGPKPGPKSGSKTGPNQRPNRAAPLKWWSFKEKAPKSVPLARVNYSDVPSYKTPRDVGSWHRFTGADLSYLARPARQSRTPRHIALSILVMWVLYYLWFKY